MRVLIACTVCVICCVKDRDDSDSSADASQSLLAHLPSAALFPADDADSAPIDTSVWFEQSMHCLLYTNIRLCCFRTLHLVHYICVLCTIAFTRQKHSFLFFLLLTNVAYH